MNTVRQQRDNRNLAVDANRLTWWSVVVLRHRSFNIINVVANFWGPLSIYNLRIDQQSSCINMISCSLLRIMFDLIPGMFTCYQYVQYNYNTLWVYESEWFQKIFVCITTYRSLEVEPSIILLFQGYPFFELYVLNDY